MTLVVAGHSDITPDYKELWIFKWAYSFHMPLFFFISGYLFCLTNPVEKMIQNGAYSAFIKKKVSRLLMPFLFINSLIFIIKATLITDPSIMQHPATLDIYSFIDTTFLHPTGFMWFLPALFMVFTISFPLYRFVKTDRLDTLAIGGGKSLIIIILMILFFICIRQLLPVIDFMQTSQAIYYITYFLTGVLYCENKRVADRFVWQYRFIIIPLFLILSASLMFKGYFAALAGIVFTTSLALVLEEKYGNLSVKISSLCYTVFLLSYFPQMFIRGPIAHNYPDINQYWLSALSFVMGILTPVAFGLVFLKLKNRHKIVGKTGILFGL